MNRNVVVDRLDNYFKGGYQLNRTPLLCGPTGVAKSALVKEAARRNNMRVVDIRCAFISRLDIQGLSEKIEKNGRYYSESSPMFNLVRCSDEYIDMARESCRIIEEEIKVSDDNHQIVLKQSLAKLSEEAKTPVLFFDEITRAEASVRQVMTKILSDKAFDGLHFGYARVVAATNSQLDGNDEQVDLYSTNSADDVAFYDRFESVYVSPEMMNSTWLRWAKDNLNDVIYGMAKENPYDSTHFSTDNIREAMVTPYPCYRTWELASRYMDRTGSSLLVPYLIGGAGNVDMSKFIEEAVNSCTPALVISPSGMSKTSQIKQICEANNYELIEINISEVDRLDVSGFPVKSSTLKAMFDGIKINKNIAQKVSEAFKTSNLPSNVTVRAPKASYKEQFERALATGNKVVIFFDEVNRVQNVNVMSAVFEVISDNRLFGVEFNPENVSTICACNYDENCSDAQDLDPAMVARMAIYRVESYSDKYADKFVDYAKSQGFAPVVLSYLESKGKDLAGILSSVNSRTLEFSAPSTRGWEDLSKTIAFSTDSLLTGKCLISSEEEYDKISEFTRYDVRSEELTSIVKGMASKIDDWAIKDVDDKFVWNGKELPVASFLTTAKVFLSLPVEEVLSSKESLQDIIRAEQEVWDYRRQFFSIFLGSQADDFLNYYNSYNGVEVVKASSLDPDSVIKSILEMEYDETAVAAFMNSFSDDSKEVMAKALETAWYEMAKNKANLPFLFRKLDLATLQSMSLETLREATSKAELFTPQPWEEIEKEYS